MLTEVSENYSFNICTYFMMLLYENWSTNTIDVGLTLVLTKKTVRSSFKAVYG